MKKKKVETLTIAVNLKLKLELVKIAKELEMSLPELCSLIFCEGGHKFLEQVNKKKGSKDSKKAASKKEQDDVNEKIVEGTGIGILDAFIGSSMW